MKKLFLGIFLISLLMTSILNAKIIKTCDSFLFLVDESASMQDIYRGTEKIKLEKNILKKINMAIPDADYTSTLRTFSHISAYVSKAFYPVAPYSMTRMCKAIANIKAYHQWTSIGYGLDASNADLSKMNGIKHLIIFSDGNENSTYTSPDKVAKTLKSKYSDLCIFAVQIGNSTNGKTVLQSIVDAVGCGYVVSVDSLSDEDNFNTFIKDVFGYNKEIKPPAPKPVEKPIDSDKDGVYDNLDQCPGTPIGAPVNNNGCWVIDNIYFDFDKYNIKPEYIELIKEISIILKKNPSIKFEIQGHTDNRGSLSYNNKLSKKRAEQVKKEFIKNGIFPGRLSIKYFAYKKPAASNDSSAGRALNRRVVMKVIK